MRVCFSVWTHMSVCDTYLKHVCIGVMGVLHNDRVAP